MANNETIDCVIEKYNLTMKAAFVPWSTSWNKKEKFPSLNWKVIIFRNNSPIIETNYTAGLAHCPSYTTEKKTLHEDKNVRWECENGKSFIDKKNIEPDFRDVLYSLVIDAEAIDYSCFEDWAGSFGYETDSRKAEQIYKDCVAIGLKLRSVLGNVGLQEIRKVFQDY